MYGNTIIRMLASNLKDLIAGDGVVCRWGGDEFIGIIYHNVAESKIMMDELQCMVNKLETKSPLSFSCGIANRCYGFYYSKLMYNYLRNKITKRARKIAGRREV